MNNSELEKEFFGVMEKIKWRISGYLPDLWIAFYKMRNGLGKVEKKSGKRLENALKLFIRNNRINQSIKDYKELMRDFVNEDIYKYFNVLGVDDNIIDKIYFEERVNEITSKDPKAGDILKRLFCGENVLNHEINEVRKVVARMDGEKMVLCNKRKGKKSIKRRV